MRDYVKDALVFATRLLESNECNLIVPPGNQPVTLTLERSRRPSSDRESSAHLRGDPWDRRKQARHGAGFTSDVSINFPVTIEFEANRSCQHVIMRKGERAARIELDSGHYILWARISGKTTNFINCDRFEEQDSSTPDRGRPNSWGRDTCFVGLNESTVHPSGELQMRCAVCNTDNPDAAIACRSCGSPLAVEAPGGL